MRTTRLIIVIFFFLIAGAIAVITTRHHELSIWEAQASLPYRLSAKEVRMGEPVFIRSFKEESQLELWMRNESGWTLFQTYAICRWSGGLGPKLRTGDKQAPEGFYRVSRAQLNPNSRRYKAFNIGFPNEYDRALGRTGSALMVHGGCSSAGCYAMTDAEVDDIYRLVEAALAHGQEAVDVQAYPFRMTEANMARHEASQWIAFWRDLKPGYDLFEKTREVPTAAVHHGRYVVFASRENVPMRTAQLITAWD
jgi:murein L,D-transpeptidase YafK